MDLRLVKPRLMIFQKLTLEVKDIVAEQETLFLTKTPKLKTDLVDMEAYAIAKICYLENIRFKCFKFISDHADGGASNDWIENVSLGKKLFVKRIKNLDLC